jgi:AraC-like DNA-binding protein
LPYLHFLWVAETSGTPIEEPVSLPPSGCVLLTMFTNNSRYEIKLASDDGFKESPRAALQGQHHGPIVTRTTANATNAIGVMFKPSGFHNIFGVNMASLTDRISDAEVIIGPGLTKLLDSLADLKINEERIEAVMTYILRVVQEKGPLKVKSDKIVDVMQEHMGTLPVGDVAEQFQMNSRSLERIFAEEIGVSPKYLNRVMQFNNALQILKYEPGIRWAQLATRAGYYDQAHMIKAFLEFSGKSPAIYDEKDTRFTETHLTRDSDKEKNTYE